MSLDFICYDQDGLLPTQDQVFEDVTCGYHALIYSRAGCPMECPVVLRPGYRNLMLLCAGQGLCDYDSDKSAARCFCDSGWGGADCTTPGGAGAPPVSWPALGGTIVGGIVLGLALVLGGVFARAYFSGGSFFDYLNFFGNSAACALPFSVPWAASKAPRAGDYAPAPTGEPASSAAAAFTFKAPEPEPPSAFAPSSVVDKSASVAASGTYAPPSGSLNDGPFL